MYVHMDVVYFLFEVSDFTDLYFNQMDGSLDAFSIVTIKQVAILVILSFTYKRVRLYGRYFSGYPAIVM